MRTTFVNDCGFVGGAGVGLRRQVQALVDVGHHVDVVCWLDHPAPDPLPLRGRQAKGRFLGVAKYPGIHRDSGLNDGQIASAVRDLVAERKPDVVVFGNLHWAKWPLAIIDAVRDAGYAAIAYMHDCHWATGRCAYFGGCRRYMSGCDASCPTPTEYPALEPERIAGAYADRRAIFTGEGRVPIATNSAWLTKVANDAFHGQASVATVQLGLDEQLYRPAPKAWLRALLDLPQDAVIAIVGAVNLAEDRKGGPMLRATLERLQRDGRTMVIGFGHNSEYIEGVKGFGHIMDERLMPLLYGAADFMINAAHEEAFGQTLMEAAACGLPLLTTEVGGVGEVAHRAENAILVPYGDVDGMVAGIDRLAADLELRRQFGRRSREIVIERFAVEPHAARLQQLLGQQAGVR
jgi:glycosyltransferase involved in cell wall biosynthesis